MPLPMVHLSIATQLFNSRTLRPPPQFLLGSIAPDAIHMRPNSTREDKRYTHLSDNADPEHQNIRNLIHRNSEGPPRGAMFTLGYAAHILTDRLWLGTVLESFRAGLPAGTTREAERTLYYQETDQIDLELYRNEPWRARVWEELAVTEATDFPPYLSRGEIDRWRSRTLRWYDENLDTPRVHLDHITEDRINRFLREAVHMLSTTFSRWELPLSEGA